MRCKQKTTIKNKNRMTKKRLKTKDAPCGASFVYVLKQID